MRELAFVVVCVLGSPMLRADVVTYPAPPGEALSEDYQVWADGQQVDVYTARVLDPPFAGKTCGDSCNPCIKNHIFNLYICSTTHGVLTH